MPLAVPSPKNAIAVDRDIHENIPRAAKREGVSVSAWMTTAAREALHRRAGLTRSSCGKSSMDAALWKK